MLLRSFLKLASILDVPLIRISQCDSPDQVSVAEYYSAVGAFVRRVLDIIRLGLRVLDQIVEIQTHRLTPPVKFEVQNLKEYAQLDERYDLDASRTRSRSSPTACSRWRRRCSA